MTTAKGQREARLAAQLRANLVRRKAQARAQTAADPQAGAPEPLEIDPRR